MSFFFFVLLMEEALGSDSLRLRNSRLAEVKGAFSLQEREEYRDKGKGDGGTSTNRRCLGLDIDSDMEVGKRKSKINNSFKLFVAS